MVGPRVMLPLLVLVLVLTWALVAAPPIVGALVLAAVAGALVALWGVWHATPTTLRPLVRAALTGRVRAWLES